MKKWKFDRIRLRAVNIDEIDDRLLLVNLYLTQLVTLLIGSVIIFFQSQKWASLFPSKPPLMIALYGCGLAALVLAVDLVVSRFVPEDVTDDGGINERLFRKRSLLHILAITAIVAFCEEWLFRGAIQYWIGPYWTSILFAAIHVRYLRHWLMTGLVFSISYALGWLYVHSGTLAAPIAAHFLIDLVMGLIIRYRKDEPT